MATQLEKLKYDSREMPFLTCRHCDGLNALESFFCRWCGEQINASDSSVPVSSPLDSDESFKPAEVYTTTPLNQPANLASVSLNKEAINLRVSGYLIHSFVESLKTTSLQFQSGFEKAALAFLTFIPVCLLIILLSPLDAYLATKNFLKG
ncbi:MAG: hypothetical protein AB1757_09645 [Acidobacteriota bacterium]